MEWLKPFLPLIQTGLNVYLSGEFLKKTSENAKGVAVRSGVFAFGMMIFLIFLLTSVIFVFVDLGSQFENHNGVHFSGMMLSGIYLCTLGIICFGICFGISKYLAVKELEKKQAAKADVNPYTTLVQFGEVFLSQLITRMNEKTPEGSEKEPVGDSGKA